MERPVFASKEHEYHKSLRHLLVNGRVESSRKEAWQIELCV